MKKGLGILIIITGLSLFGLMGVFLVSQNGRAEEPSPSGEEALTEESVKIGDGALAETKAGEPIRIDGKTEKKEQENPDESPVQMMFAGDVLFSDHVLNAYDQAGGIHGVLDDRLRSRISQADIFMVNQEFPFSDRGTKAPDKQFTFRLPLSRVSMMNELDIDIVTLANNHALDFGEDALVDTGTALDGAGILYVGAGENLERAKKLETIEIKGKTIGFLAASRVIPVGSWNATATKPGMLTTYDPAALLEEIRKAEEIYDYVVVYVHWGIERNTTPEEYQRNMGRQYIDAGADLVIGSHPHVLQGIEYYQGKPIVYSLGNFIFGSSIPKTMLLLAEWDGDTTTLSMIPATSSAGFTREVTETAEVQSFFRYMEELSFGITIGEDGTVQAQ